MRSLRTAALLGAAALVAGAVAAEVAGAAPPAASIRWQTVVNKNDAMPNSPTGRTFNSFNQPAVNARGLVVFRARSRGGPPEGPPVRGIYTRDLSTGGAIRTIAGGDIPVPDPSNLLHPPDDLPATFTEFPSVPRIGIGSEAVVTRGNHPPVWAYELPDGSETRAGTSGVYADLDGDGPAALVTGASKLGAVSPSDSFDFEVFSVAGTPLLLPFDVFPGAPSITDAGVIAFKGNYTEGGLAKTGVFYRALASEPAGGHAYVERIASSDTPVPNPGGCAPDTSFGSTAPPSAAGGTIVFVGLDDEAEPRCGGIYRSPLEPEPPLEVLVGIGSQVPGEPGATFGQIGEGLSYDGRFIGFWAAWGSETRTVRLYCPDHGNQDRRDYCNHAGPYADGAGDPESVCDDVTDATDRCYQEREMPVHQGVFVHDARAGWTHRIARTVADFDDFVYWSYSGRVPGTGEADHGGDDGEPVRWRSSSYVAVSSMGAALRVAFKARRHDKDGIYLSRWPGRPPIVTVLETGTPGEDLDPEAPGGSLVSEVGLERDGFRGRWLVVGARIGEEDDEDGMAGIYATAP